MFPLKLKIKKDYDIFPHTYTIYDSGTLDYGLMIEDKDGNIVIDCPNYFNSHWYGFNEDTTRWTKEQWRDCLENDHMVYA